MKLRNIVAGTLICGIFLGLAAVASAGPPRQGGDPPPPQAGFEPVPIQPGKLVVDRSTGRIVQVELTPAESSLPSALTGGTDVAAKSDAPAFPPLSSSGLGGRTFHGVPAQEVRAEDMLLGDPAPGGNAGDQVSIAASTTIVTEGFEGAFPTGLWNPNGQGGPHAWDDVGCFPVAGGWSAWPAANVANPCSSANYPDNMNSLLKYGPFSLVGAQSASLDFYFRMVSQSCDPIESCDFLFWGASIDGSNYTGDFAAGTYTGGPFQNGYNFASLDLSWLAGQPQVWIGIAFVSNGDGIVGQGPFVDSISLRKNTDPRQYITDENFDVAVFPNPDWISAEGGGPEEYQWDDLPCYSRSGFWAMWPAFGGANALNPCPPTSQNYGDNMNSWLIHGPFSLEGASEAWVDFYFRNESELNNDRFWWMVSTDDQSYYGFYITGDYAAGPYGNGYNLRRFNLANVPTLGDIRGAPQVWLAFAFDSNGSVTDRGPFVDDVSVVVERASAYRTFLPVVVSNPVQLTNLYITNHTGGTLTYTVKNTPQGNITCSVANNQQKLCGTFTPGTYDWQAVAVCGTKTGTRTYPPGNDYPKPFECQ